MRTTLLASVATVALSTAAWASGNDHFADGIDAKSCSACGSSYASAGGGSAADVDHANGGLTDRDRAIVDRLVGGAWGTLVGIANNQAKYQQEGRTYIVDINPPPSKPAQRPAPKPASKPGTNLAVAPAPDHTVAPAPTPEPVAKPPAPAPEPAPGPAPDPAILSMSAPSHKLADAIQQIANSSKKKNTRLSKLESSLRADANRRMKQIAADLTTMRDISPPTPGAKIGRTPKSKQVENSKARLEEALRALGNQAVKEHPGPLTKAEKRSALALSMSAGAVTGALAGGKVGPGGIGTRTAGALLGMTAAYAKGTLTGKTNFDELAKGAYTRKEVEAAADYYRNATPEEQRRVEDAARHAVRQQRARDQKDRQADSNQREHGK